MAPATLGALEEEAIRRVHLESLTDGGTLEETGAHHAAVEMRRGSVKRARHELRASASGRGEGRSFFVLDRMAPRQGPAPARRTPYSELEGPRGRFARLSLRDFSTSFCRWSSCACRSRSRSAAPGSSSEAFSSPEIRISAGCRSFFGILRTLGLTSSGEICSP